MRPRHSGAHIQTKLVATIGPASSSPDRLRELLEAGVDVCRLNFSHGELEHHEAVLRLVRRWSDDHDAYVAVLGDLCGPKIRLNRVRGDAAEIETGHTLRIVPGTADATAEVLTTSYEPLCHEVQVGHRVYIDDGLVRLLVVDTSASGLVCTCIAGGTISSRKGVNLPDTTLSVPALTDKDRVDAEWAVRHGLDYLALSFVRQPADLQEMISLTNARAGGPGAIVKIEKAEALRHLCELIAAADGVMVARGDLGVEMDLWRVPIVQKEITARCREAGKPVIIATQMLQSMVSNPSPTRAEVSDVANAILDANDAVMLSGESAAGRFPVASVEMMGLVAEAAEAHLRSLPPPDDPFLVHVHDRRASAVAQAAVRAARYLAARLVVVWTTSGETVRLVAGHRLRVPVVGLSSDERVLRRMKLLFGVVPLRADPIDHPGLLSDAVEGDLVRHGLARPGDVIVVVASTHPTEPGETDTVVVHCISQHAGGGR